MIKILLGRDDVNPDKLDRAGQTPLLLAARNRHKGIVKIFLRRDDVNPNKLDEDLESPL